MKKFDCGNCPLDPCSLDGDECGLFLDICESFQKLTDLRYANEYARVQSSDTTARDKNE